MQIAQLRYFLEVAKTENITTAAHNLYVSQPSVSQQILNLEQELGVQLLVRRAKAVALTDAGIQFRAHAQRIINELEQLGDLMQQQGMLLGGTLRLGQLFTAGYVGILDLVGGFHEKYPEISMEMDIGISGALLQKVLDMSLNAAFIMGGPALEKHGELYCRKLFEDRYMAVVSAKNPLAQKAKLTIADLAGQPLIMPIAGSPFRKKLDAGFAECSFTPRVMCESSQTDEKIQLVSHNLAIGFVSGLVGRAAQNEEVRLVPLEMELTHTIYYVTMKSLLEYPTIKAFTEYVNAWCDASPEGWRQGTHD